MDRSRGRKRIAGSVVGTNDGEYTLDDAPTSVVIPSEAPFEVYQPFIQTSVSLSSNAGWPGGDDLVATFTIGHLVDSLIDFETGSSVTVHLDWPDFLVIAGDLPCLGFVPDAAPDKTGGTCVIDDLGPPGWSEQLTARFTMPSSVDDPVNGCHHRRGVDRRRHRLRLLGRSRHDDL